jgi:hypothetical protein
MTCILFNIRCWWIHTSQFLKYLHIKTKSLYLSFWLLTLWTGPSVFGQTVGTSTSTDAWWVLPSNFKPIPHHGSYCIFGPHTVRILSVEEKPENDNSFKHFDLSNYWPSWNLKLLSYKNFSISFLSHLWAITIFIRKYNFQPHNLISLTCTYDLKHHFTAYVTSTNHKFFSVARHSLRETVLPWINVTSTNFKSLYNM